MHKEAKDRAAKNEALFRDLNERVKAIDEAHGLPVEEDWEFLCECGDAECVEHVRLTVAEYEEIRRSPVHFAVRRGHEMPEIERVVSETDRFMVVEKLPRGAEDCAAAGSSRGVELDQDCGPLLLRKRDRLVSRVQAEPA